MKHGILLEASMERAGGSDREIDFGQCATRAGHCRERETDRKDGKRLAELTRHGQIRPSYVPPRAILELRDLTRYRNKLLSAGSSERNRVQKVLEDANIKLGSVLSDVFGVSGQKMLQAIVKEDKVDTAKVAQHHYGP